jgi:hypothetical protein
MRLDKRYPTAILIDCCLDGPAISGVVQRFVDGNLANKFCPLLDVIGTVNHKAILVSLRIDKVQGPLLLFGEGRKKR